jgi:hypothetical protein
MRKGFLLKFLFGLSILAVAVLYLLQQIGGILPEEISTPNILVIALSAFWSILFLFKAIKGDTVTKKFNILVAVGLAVLAIYIFLLTILHDTSLLWPIIGIGVALVFVLGVLFTGGKSFDTADNQKVGYKNYHQRKAEEEKKNKKD